MERELHRRNEGRFLRSSKRVTEVKENPEHDTDSSLDSNTSETSERKREYGTVRGISIAVGRIANEVEMHRSVRYESYGRLVTKSEAYVLLMLDFQRDFAPHLFTELAPFKDSLGLWRVGGRSSNTQLEFEKAHPIIIYKKTVITEALVIDAHERSGHKGKNYTSHKVMNKYWIIGLHDARDSKLQERTN